MDNEKRIRLLQFVTGTCRLPVGDSLNSSGTLPLPPQLQKGGDSSAVDKTLPVFLEASQWDLSVVVLEVLPQEVTCHRQCSFDTGSNGPQKFCIGQGWQGNPAAQEP